MNKLGKILLALLFIPCVIVAFSFLMMFSWAACNDNGKSSEAAFAVNGSWAWIFINPIIGLILAVTILIIIFRMMQQKNTIWRIIIVNAIVFFCVYSGWFGILFSVNYSEKQKWQQWEADARRKAEQNDMESLFRMGNINMQKDIPAAIRYYKAAADLGHDQALLALGLIYCFEADHLDLSKDNPYLNYSESARCFEILIDRASPYTKDAQLYLKDIPAEYKNKTPLVVETDTREN